MLMVPVGPGELIDKLTILEIKLDRIPDPAKVRNVRVEYDLLEDTARQHIADSDSLRSLRAELKRINEALWVIEDDIRLCEKAGDFGPTFIELARAVYKTNDQRAAVKRRINDLLDSRIVEEKSYES